MKLQQKIGLLFAAVALLIVAVTLSVVLMLRKNAPVKFDPKSSPAETMAFIASDTFKNLPLEQQKEYLKAMRENRRNAGPPQAGEKPPQDNLTEEQRRAAFQNMRRAREAEMNERLDKFFAMSKEEQLAELDKRIAERKQRDAGNSGDRRNRRGGPGAPGGNNAAPAQNAAAAKTDATKTDAAKTENSSGANQQRKRPSAQDMRNHYEEMSPATRTKMRAYMTMERLRAEGKL